MKYKIIQITGRERKVIDTVPTRGDARRMLGVLQLTKGKADRFIAEGAGGKPLPALWVKRLVL